MATIVVEDGTSVAGSNSYCSLQQATDYHTAYGNSAFIDADGDAQTLALVQAAQQIDLLYGAAFIGFYPSVDQSMQWPRMAYLPDGDTYTFGGLMDSNGLYRDGDTIPKELIAAQCHAALLIIQGLSLVYDAQDPNENLSEETVKVGEIQTTQKFFSKASRKSLNRINSMLSPILKSSAGGIRLVRG